MGKTIILLRRTDVTRLVGEELSEKISQWVNEELRVKGLVRGSNSKGE